MAHKHSVYDSDTHLRINATTRTFAVEGFTKNTIVQYDHNSERFTFELPRFIEGHDMLDCNSVQVHYLNVDAKTQETSSGVFVVTDLQESPEDEDIAIFSWLISSNATKYVGSLNFSIRFACISEDNAVDYAWNTAVNTTMRVTDGINNAEIIIQEYADVLEQWKQDITSNIYDFLPEHLQFGSDGVTEILPPTELFYGGDDFCGVMALIEGVEIGETYTVNYNGVDYESTAQLFEGNGNTVTVLGNMGAVVGSGDNGQPFVLMILPPEAFAEEGVGGLLMPLDGATSVTLSISCEKIKKLDNKYIDAEWMATHSKNEVVLYDDVVRFNSAGSKTFIEPLFNIVVGKLYEVSFNGTVYTCYGKTYTHSANGNFNAIGNLSLSSKDAYGTPAGEDTGEPFIISSPMQGNISILTSMLTTMGQGDVAVRVVEKEEKISKLPYKFNTEPIIFTTMDMQSATCNKTYQECVEAINNNYFNAYFVMEMEGIKSVGSFKAITLAESIEFVADAGESMLYFRYYEDGTVTITME